MFVRGCFACCGTWETTPTPDGLQRLVLTSSLAYHTGWNAWTQAGLAALEATVRPGMRVAAIGCGAGLLAIAAALLGASVVYALDVPPAAVRTTWDTAKANGVARQLMVRQERLVPGHVDVALVSISTAWAEKHRADYDATTLLVVHDDATWARG